jgi:hypothetical protein
MSSKYSYLTETDIEKLSRDLGIEISYLAKMIFEIKSEYDMAVVSTAVKMALSIIDLRHIINSGIIDEELDVLRDSLDIPENPEKAYHDAIDEKAARADALYDIMKDEG